MSTYFAILTQVGEAKLANAIALGQTLKLKKMGVGDGNGTLPVPDRGQKALVREVHRADLNKLDKDPDNTSQIIAEQVLPENVGGWWMRELGIYDEAGDLCAVANCPPSYKPLMAEGSGRMQVVRIVLIVASTAAIELKIDPSIILATRKYVDDQDITVRAYSDAQLAKHLAAADPHPLLAKVTYVDQQDTSARTYGDQQLAKHQAAADPHPLLAKVTYVDQQDTSARTYGDQQLAKHQAAADPHPLLAKVTYVDQQDSSARTYGDQQLAKHLAAVDPHPLLAKVTYVDQQDTSARTYGDQQLAMHLKETQGNIGPMGIVSASRTLTASDVGSSLFFNSAGLALTLPKPSDIGLVGGTGKCVYLFGTVAAGTIAPGAGVTLGFNGVSVPSLTLKPGQSITMTANGPSAWQILHSTADMFRNLDFSGELSVLRNWRRLPNGDIEQWGTIAGSASMAPFTPNLTFPIAFPNACRAITVQCMNELSSAGYSGRTTDKTLSRTGAWVSNSNGVTAVPDVLCWRAIGN